MVKVELTREEAELIKDSLEGYDVSSSTKYEELLKKLSLFISESGVHNE